MWEWRICPTKKMLNQCPPDKYITIVSIKNFKLIWSETQKNSLEVVLVHLLVTLNIVYTLLHCFYCFEGVFIWWGCTIVVIPLLWMAWFCSHLPQALFPISTVLLINSCYSNYILLWKLIAFLKFVRKSFSVKILSHFR